MTIRGWSTSNSDQMSCLFAGQRLAIVLLFLVMQHCLQSAREVPLSYLDRGVAADAECLANLGVGPAVGGFEQRISARKGACIGFACMNECLEGGSISFGQSHRNGMLHGELSVFSSVYHLRQTQEIPLSLSWWKPCMALTAGETPQTSSPPVEEYGPHRCRPLQVPPLDQTPSSRA